MANESIGNIFLSASIPSINRENRYFETMDIIAIRESVKALASVVIPATCLIWGGHPSITPLISSVLKKFDYNEENHVKLYQSNFFRDKFPNDNNSIDNIVLIEEEATREASIDKMREKMITDNNYIAGIFIGGMEGVEFEFELFRKSNSEAKLLPIASTGGAARIIYDNYSYELMLSKRLETDYTYISLFRDLILEE